MESASRPLARLVGSKAHPGHWRAISPGANWPLQAARRRRDPKVHTPGEGSLYGSQADSEGSIPFTRSDLGALCSRKARTGGSSPFLLGARAPDPTVGGRPPCVACGLILQSTIAG